MLPAVPNDDGPARLRFRPRPASGRIDAGDGPLGVGTDRDGVLYVPDIAERGAPCLVLLHGAMGTGRRELRAVVAAADRYGVVVVAPDSRGATWDIIFMQQFGPDIEFLDLVLEHVAVHLDVDMDRLALGGISDGASYALSVGLANGDVFGSVIAFSPGFAVVPAPHGEPRVFVSHGVHDPILPIDTCSRRLVPSMADAGYHVTYAEFDGGHEVPPPVADRAFRWWLENVSQA